MSYKVAEIFTSINGEGRKAGELSVFVRLTGCNLSCSYCDTSWANLPGAVYHLMTAEEILAEVSKSGVLNVTLTGGEPLLAENITELISLLGENGFKVEIETNGSVPIEAFHRLAYPPSLTLDYKLPGSGMEDFMYMDNYCLVNDNDTVKFVCSDERDLEKARAIIDKYQLTDKCAVYLSPVFGRIEPALMVEYMKKNRMNKVRLQLQLHKFIWDPMAKGV